MSTVEHYDKEQLLIDTVTAPSTDTFIVMRLWMECAAWLNFPI